MPSFLTFLCFATANMDTGWESYNSFKVSVGFACGELEIEWSLDLAYVPFVAVLYFC